MFTALTVLATGTLDGPAAGPSELGIFFAFFILAFPKPFRLFVAIFIPFLVVPIFSKRVCKIVPILHPCRGQGRQVPLKIVELLTAGVVGLFEEAATIQYRLQRQWRRF